ncbi:hypothetical protein ACB092_07G003900 [Castanea dentata]
MAVKGASYSPPRTCLRNPMSFSSTMPLDFSPLRCLQTVAGGFRIAEGMAALMCVDVDLNSNAEEETEEVVDGISHQNGTKLSVFEAMESVIHGAKENGDGAVRWLELEELDIDDDTFLSLDLSSRFPGLLALSLCGNKLENVEIIAREVTKFEQLRALWLNNNPVVKNCDSQLENRVLQGLPRLEIYNSRFTAKFGAWALGFCGGVYGKDNPGSIHEGDHQLESVSSLDLSDRCIHNLITFLYYGQPRMFKKEMNGLAIFFLVLGRTNNVLPDFQLGSIRHRIFFIKEYEKHCKKLQSKSLISPSIQSSTTRSIHHTDGSPLRVYTDLPHVEEFLTRSEFVIISEPKDADIVWRSTQVDEDMKKAAGITDQQYINQFPFEACLVMKHHLAETVHKAYGSPEWLQPTYNLETHLSQLFGDYYVRKRDGLDNLWILKPWNMA